MTSRALQKNDRIAIINRGESAMRFLNAVRDFNSEYNTQLQTIALYTKPDQHAKFVQRADRSWCLGEAFEPDLGQLDENGVPVMKSPYLTYERLEQALVETGANAVWVGWGFVAEHAEFVDLCDEMGIVFLGPTGDSMRMLGDKIGSKELAEKSGVPVSPWSNGAVVNVAEAKKAGEKIGYPLVVKATAGGGGRGIRVVRDPANLEEAFHSATAEAAKAFGDGTVFMEKMIVDARHLEVQIIADNYGTVWPAGIRDCSVQRRNQKVIEEGPAVMLTPEQNEALKKAATNIAAASNYRNAGTAEFLYANDEFYFMEMNTRLQVEHPVTEVTTGLDLVKMQIKMAMGHKLEGAPPVTRGHAIEVRLNAEDPYNQFAPSPGKINLFTPPGGFGIRVDSGVETGNQIPSEFDSMIAKIIAFGETRNEALARMERALKDTQIFIQDGATNKAFLLELLGHPVYRENKVTTAWLDGLMAEGIGLGRKGRQVALIVAAIEMYTRKLHERRRAFFETVSRGRPQKLPMATPVEVEMRLEGISYKLEINLLEAEYYRIHYEDIYFDVKFVRDAGFKARLYYDEVKYECSVSSRQQNLQVEVDGVSFLVEQDSGGLVRSNSPAVVLKIHVEKGQKIKEGEPLVTLEAMKMEMMFLAPESGRIGEIFVKTNVQVGAGDPMLMIEQDVECDDAVPGSCPVTFSKGSLPEKMADPCHQVLRECRAFMKGYDVHLFSFENMLRQIPETVKELAQTTHGREELVDFTQQLCNLYIHIEFLFLKQVSVSDTDISSPEQNFFIYLQLMRTGNSHPADDFIDYLKKALAHYDVEPYRPTDPLEETLIHIFHSHNHLSLKQRVMQALFHAIEGSGAFNDNQRLKIILEEVINASRNFYRELYDMAVDCYYQVFEKACFDMSVEHAWRNLDAILEKLEHAEGENRNKLIRKITYSPHSLLKYFIAKFESSDHESRKAFCEILLRRIHLEHSLKDIRSGNKDEIIYTMANYMVDRNIILNITLAAPFELLAETLETLQELVERSHGYQEIIVDLYMDAARTLPENEYAGTIDKELKKLPKLALITRIRTIIGDEFPLARCFHFHASRNGFQEKRLFRGISEMLANRLYLERLQGFETARMPTEENINLFYCMAKDNPDDQRLIAFNEVRESAPSRSEGSPFIFPALHREFLMIMKAMRHGEDKLSGRGAFYWNQVIIYIRPVLQVGREEFLSYLRQMISGYQQVKLEKIRIYVLLGQPHGDVANVQVEVNFPGGMGLELRYTAPTTPVITPLSPKDFRLALARRRKLNYPYETIRLMTDGYFYRGEFEEYDVIINEENRYETVSVKGRPDGENKLGIVFGVITNFMATHPEGMKRVILLGDGNFGLGCLSEPECRHVLAAIDLAEQLQVPLEWFTVSSGAKISMDNGTENLDWTAVVLRKIIEFTQSGGEINLVVDAINVGAQSYWNAEATMLMHTKGCLIMTPRGSMVLTGKSALDYSGSVSAEDNIGIGGLQRIMGPNGQAQYPANDLLHACKILFRYYSFTYCAPGERYPRSYTLEDPADRDICLEPYSYEMTPDFTKIGDIFSDETNPGKKKPFDMRQVMAAVADKGQKSLERWPLLLDGDTALVWDTTVGGICVSMIGIQSHPIKRRSEVPNDGPDTWSGGTLFPNSSRKLARGINAASGRRPVVILANLSGFDGSPESLRRLQLEYGAEIGRAVVNFDGPMIFCVLSRYHGGAYVVFSTKLNKNLKSVALNGAFASVIGGAPAAAVVFTREVRKRTAKDDRLIQLQDRLNLTSGADRNKLQAQYSELQGEVLREKQGDVAAEFESVHTVQRARDVGSLDDILEASSLRPYIIQSLKEGMEQA